MAAKQSKGSKAKAKSKPKSTAKGTKKKPRTQASKASKAREKELASATDKEQAERMGLLQLRIGRASHLYSMAGAISLATSGIILLLTQPGRPFEDLPGDAKTILPWIAPILTGAFVATSALYVKWKPFAGSRTSGHFLLTTLAFLISTITLLIVMRQAFTEVEPQNLARVYPASLSGISLTLISMAMTWRGMGRRKLLSMLSAALPMVIFAYGFNPIFSAGIPPDLLILTFMGSAVAVQFSGSMLHIIASSTSVQAKEVIRVSKDRLQIIQDQLKARTGALDYKEEALHTREADIEAQEKALEERTKALEDVQKDLKDVEARIDKERKDLKKQEKGYRGKEADLAAREEKAKLREEDLAKQEKELAKASGALSKRKSGIAKTEKELAKAKAQAEVRRDELAQKEKELRETEKTLRGQRKELEAAKDEILQKEGELQVRESALELRGGVPLPEKASEAVAELNRIKSRLLEKDKALSHKEVDLRKTEERLKSATQRAEEWKKKADKTLQDIKAKERELAAKENALADRETSVERRWNDVQSQLDLLEGSVRRVKDKEAKYEKLYKKAHSRAANAAEAEKSIKTQTTSLEQREAKLEEIAKRLMEERDAMTSQHQDILRRQKALEARESELKLRQMEMESRLKHVTQVGPASEGLGEQEKALRLWEERLKEKEKKMKSRLYEKEKELREWENALREGLVEVEEEEEREEETVEDRVTSGTPRLDDLLLGGLPLNSQILFVGPAFVGKEIGILNFVAEGLREGVPCVLITTSRPPEEIAKEMGPILPSFKEYEQLDLVRWIDGSSPVSGTKKKTPIVEGNTYIVKGAGDYEGILKALKKIESEFRKEDYPYLRLAYMTLSTSLTQGSEKEALNFVQRFVNHMRKSQSVSIYAVERGMHSDQLIEALEHQMDGAIHFKVERQKNLLSVAGICDVQTRDWVEYKHTNRSLMIGAFMLERIK